MSTPTICGARRDAPRAIRRAVLGSADGIAVGLDAGGQRIDALTTNPGHALWCAIAEPELANTYLDRLVDTALFTGYGLRTLAPSMGAYDPLSYHNGSVWPHDTAIVAAGAARYGRWDLVDMLADGALDAAAHFAFRPPELFAGIDRSALSVPVVYPASCRPQAWSSASILLLVRTILGLDVGPDGLAVPGRISAGSKGWPCGGCTPTSEPTTS